MGAGEGGSERAAHLRVSHEGHALHGRRPGTIQLGDRRREQRPVRRLKSRLWQRGWLRTQDLQQQRGPGLLDKALDALEAVLSARSAPIVHEHGLADTDHEVTYLQARALVEHATDRESIRGTNLGDTDAICIVFDGHAEPRPGVSQQRGSDA